MGGGGVEDEEGEEKGKSGGKKIGKSGGKKIGESGKESEESRATEKGP